MLKISRGSIVFKCVLIFLMLSSIFQFAETALANKLKNGLQCAEMPGNIIDPELIVDSKNKCQSNYCYPGPGERGMTTEWYCIDQSMNCSWQGTDGFRYGQTKSLGKQSFTCVNPRDGGFAQALPRRFWDSFFFK